MERERHPADSYTFPSGETLRLMGPRILVQADEEPETTVSGILIKPQTAHEHVFATGTILAFGYITEKKMPMTTKTKNIVPQPIPELEVGMKCCFVKFQQKLDSNQMLQAHFGNGISILKPEDLLFAFPPDHKFELNQ